MRADADDEATLFLKRNNRQKKKKKLYIVSLRHSEVLGRYFPSYTASSCYENQGFSLVGVGPL